MKITKLRVTHGEVQRYFIKVGISSDVEVRKFDLEENIPFKLEILAKKEVGTEARRLERGLHLALMNRRVRGEWFSLTEETTKALCSFISSYPKGYELLTKCKELGLMPLHARTQANSS